MVIGVDPSPSSFITLRLNIPKRRYATPSTFVVADAVF